MPYLLSWGKKPQIFGSSAHAIGDKRRIVAQCPERSLALAPDQHSDRG